MNARADVPQAYSSSEEIWSALALTGPGSLKKIVGFWGMLERAAQKNINITATILNLDFSKLNERCLRVRAGRTHSERASEIARRKRGCGANA